MRAQTVIILSILTACAHPMPLSDAPDYCSQLHVMRAEEWRALCGQYPRAAVLDGGAP